MSESFKEKLRSIQWSPTTKNPGSRKNYYDGDALKDNLLFSDRETEMRETSGVGFMRRDKKGTFYRKSRTDGSYERASAKDLDRMLGGPEKEASG